MAVSYSHAPEMEGWETIDTDGKFALSAKFEPDGVRIIEHVWITDNRYTELRGNWQPTGQVRLTYDQLYALNLRILERQVANAT